MTPVQHLALAAAHVNAAIEKAPEDAEWASGSALSGLSHLVAAHEAATGKRPNLASWPDGQNEMEETMNSNDEIRKDRFRAELGELFDRYYGRSMSEIEVDWGNARRPRSEEERRRFEEARAHAETQALTEDAYLKYARATGALPPFAETSPQTGRWRW